MRHVDEKGYKVRNISWFLWVTLVISIVFPFSYCWLRFVTYYNDDRSHDIKGDPPSWDDLISTSISIITLCVGAVITCLLNTRYKGEALFDVLSNTQKIDTQEEFKSRAMNQTRDILEVLRQSNESPGFFWRWP